jgi:hypothetical protein
LRRRPQRIAREWNSAAKKEIAGKKSWRAVTNARNFRQKARATIFDLARSRIYICPECAPFVVCQLDFQSTSARTTTAKGKNTMAKKAKKPAAKKSGSKKKK